MRTDHTYTRRHFPQACVAFVFARPAMAAPPEVLAAAWSEDDLKRAQAHKGSLRLWSFTQERFVVLSGWEGTARLAVHGLSGHGRVHEDATGEPVFGTAVKVHICRHRPCGYRYDNRVEPYSCHCRPVGLLAAETLGVALASSGVEAPGIPALCDGAMDVDEGAAPIEEAAERDEREAGPEDLAICEPEVPGGVVLPPEPRAAGMAPGKRRALELCLADDVVAWCRPHSDLPHLLFVLWSIVHLRPVRIVCGQSVFAAVQEFAPWAISSGLFPEDETEPAVYVLACQVRVTPGSECRHLAWPHSLTGVNHWHAAAEIEGALELGHAPCLGDLCGDPQEPCVGLLLDDLAARSLSPFPTACDGDCGADVCLFWEGRPQTQAGRSAIRGWLADCMWERRFSDEWLYLYDTMALPNWEAKAAELAAETMLGAPALAAKGAAKPEVVDAVSWALRGTRGKSQDELAVLASCLDEEQGRYWLDKMTEERRQEETMSVATPKAKSVPGRAYHRYQLEHRVAAAKKFLATVKRNGPSKMPRGCVAKFCKEHGIHGTKRSRQQFMRIVSRLEKGTIALAGQSLSNRARFPGKQGAHLIKAPVLREEFAKWFFEIRGVVKGRLPMSVFRLKAQKLREECLRTALQAKVRFAVPAITPGWLWRFRKEYAISLRQPNRRWKVPRAVLLARLRIMWRNTIRLRTMALVLLGHDLPAEGFDQKPFHMNEAGSKRQLTLAVRGSPEVALKELHEATRERWTASTWVTSRRETALAGPPLEVLFKGATGILANLEAHIAEKGHRVTAQTSNSGSYRREHVLTFLERALPATKPAGAPPWRLVYCDAYRSHDNEPVRRLAWEHGAVIVLHGGGTTGVAQVNDTHLHGPLSKAYQDMEMQAGFLELALNPKACPRRTREQCVDDLATVWRRPDIHLTALAGWKANMIMVALDGSEDRFGSDEMRGYWDEVGMDAQRRDIIDEVCRECEAGRLQWTYEVVHAQIEAVPVSGHLDFYEEGQEDEGELVGDGDEGEPPWQEGEGPSEDEAEPLELPAAPAAPPTLTESQSAEVTLQASRLRALEDAAALAPPDARLEKAFAAVRRSYAREASGRSQADAVVAQAVRSNESLRRDAAQQLHEELLRRQAAREAQAKALADCVAGLDEKIEALRHQEIALAAAGQRESEARKAGERRLALAAVATGFTTNELGQGQAGGGADRFRKARFELVTQVAVLGEELPLAIAARLPQWVRRWDAQGALQYDRAWGSVVRDEMTEVVRRISAGDTTYFRHWHGRWTRRWGLDRDDVVVPGRLGTPPP